MQHYDFLGKNIHIGDTVATFAKEYREMIKGEVIKITPCKIRIKYRWQNRFEEFLVAPTDVINITFKTGE